MGTIFVLQVLISAPNSSLLFTTWFATPYHNQLQGFHQTLETKSWTYFQGIHYGYDKASVDSLGISEFHTLFTELVFSMGYSLACWQSGLQVLLEKKPGAIFVSKLHALLLLEADFNAGMKIWLAIILW